MTFPAQRLFLGIYDQPNGRLIMDLSGRAEDVEISYDRRGPKSLTAFVPLSLNEALTIFDPPGVAHVLLTDGVVPLWSGRLEDPRLSFTARDGGVQITALGYRRALRDLPYTALWSETSVANWRPVLSTEFGDHHPDRYVMDTNNRLYIAPKKGSTFDAFYPMGGMTYATPAGGSRPITTIAFTYTFNAPAGWVFALRSSNRDFTAAAYEWYVQSAGSALSATTTVTLPTPRDRITFSIYPVSAGTYNEETGVRFVRITNLRVTSASTPITADAILRDLHARIRAENPAQLAATTALIQAPGLDLMNEIYLDADMLALADRLSELGDTQSPPRRWEWGVDAEQQFYFRPRGSGGRHWYIDLGEVELERTLDALANSAYAVYETANNERMVTATATDAASVTRWGLTRRRAIPARTTSATQAATVRDLALADRAQSLPRATIPVPAIYDAHGQQWPLWLVAGGDTMTIRNLSPSVHPAIDQIRTFGVEEVVYRPADDMLTITPDAPLPTLEWFLARQEAST